MKNPSLTIIISLLCLVILGFGRSIIHYFNTDDITTYPYPYYADTLIDNLRENDYTINEYDRINDINIKSSRIYAQNGASLVDACYDFSKDDLDQIYSYYDKLYKTSEPYLLTINYEDKLIVYCCSDEKAYEESGFSHNADIIIKYQHDNK